MVEQLVNKIRKEVETIKQWINILKLIKKLSMNQKLKRTKCETYTRCVGYLAPVQRFNKGKLEEWKDRLMFKIK